MIILTKDNLTVFILIRNDKKTEGTTLKAEPVSFILKQINKFKEIERENEWK